MKKQFIIFGATGRYLIPALSELYEAGKLPDGFNIIGVGRNNLDTESFRRHIDEKLKNVPFILRTGKALFMDCMEILLTFKPVPHSVMGKDAARRNIIRLGLNPNRIALGANITTPCEHWALNT
jgi:glucose-6-phosphate 1-dehydrogenase